LKSLSSNITLEPFDRQYENDARNIHTARTINSNMITEFERIFNDWSEQIQEALEGADAERKEERNAGP
jgi:hypothetical protein